MRWPFGKNQTLAITIFSTIYFSTYALVWAGRMDGASFSTFAMWFGPACLAAILGPAAFIKARLGGSSNVEKTK